MAVLEKDIEKSILDYLNAIGCIAWKNPSVGVWDQKRKQYRKPASKYLIKGVSDIICVTPMSKVVFIEVKSAKGRLSDDQKLFLLRMKRMGVDAFVARSIDDVKEYFIEHSL